MLMNQDFWAFFEFMNVLINKNKPEIISDKIISGCNSNASILNRNIEAKNKSVNSTIRKNALCNIVCFSFDHPKIVSCIVRM